MPKSPDSIAAPGAVCDDRSLRLPVHGTTVTAEDLRVRLVLAGDIDGEMVIDASEVESVGQAVLQLLVAARREAVAQGQAFILAEPSAAFVERVSACKLNAALGLNSPEEALQ
jgi:anti-anti-sigma regulatory factor